MGPSGPGLSLDLRLRDSLMKEYGNGDAIDIGFREENKTMFVCTRMYSWPCKLPGSELKIIIDNGLIFHNEISHADRTWSQQTIVSQVSLERLLIYPKCKHNII